MDMANNGLLSRDLIHGKTWPRFVVVATLATEQSLIIVILSNKMAG
jgi:hypothetical protein